MWETGAWSTTAWAEGAWWSEYAPPVDNPPLLGVVLPMRRPRRTRVEEDEAILLALLS